MTGSSSSKTYADSQVEFGLAIAVMFVTFPLVSAMSPLAWGLRGLAAILVVGSLPQTLATSVSYSGSLPWWAGLSPPGGSPMLRRPGQLVSLNMLRRLDQLWSGSGM